MSAEVSASRTKDFLLQPTLHRETKVERFSPADRTLEQHPDDETNDPRHGHGKQPEAHRRQHEKRQGQPRTWTSQFPPFIEERADEEATEDGEREEKRARHHAIPCKPQPSKKGLGTF